MKIFTPALIIHGKSAVLSELFDCLQIEKINERKIKIEKIKGYKIPTNNSNPVFKAAAFMQNMKSNKLGAVIKISKNIPASCGLSSMSGNAAGAIIALNRLWNFGLTEKEMINIAKKISNETKIILKFGLKSESKNKTNLILICPKYIKIDKEWLKIHVKTEKNAESVILKHFPDIREIIGILKKNGYKIAGISGKGPVIFGISKNPVDYRMIKKSVKNKAEFIWSGKSCNNWGKLLD